MVKFDQISWPKGTVLSWSGSRTPKTKDYPALGGMPGKGGFAGWAIMDGSFYDDVQIQDRSHEIETHKDGKVVRYDIAPIIKL